MLPRQELPPRARNLPPNFPMIGGARSAYFWYCSGSLTFERATQWEFCRLGGNDCAGHYDKDCKQIFSHRYTTYKTSGLTKVGTVHPWKVLAVPSAEQFGVKGGYRPFL